MAWQPDYISGAELKSYLRIDDLVDDVEIGFAVTAASRSIDQATNRQFGLVAALEERTYEACWSRRHGLYRVRIDDLMTEVGLVVTAAGSATSSYRLDPRNAAARGRPWTRLYTTDVTPDPLGSGPPTVLVEASWGWSAVPDEIKEATLLQASRLFSRRNAPFGVAGSPDAGSELRLLAKVDPDVEVTVRPFRRDHPLL